MDKIKPSEVTPERLYLSRRQFITGVGAVVAGSMLLSACERGGVSTKELTKSPLTGAAKDELGAKLTSFKAVTNYRSEERRVGKECRSRWSPYH